MLGTVYCMLVWCTVCSRAVYCMVGMCTVCYGGALYVMVVYCKLGRCTVW